MEFQARARHTESISKKKKKTNNKRVITRYNTWDIDYRLLCDNNSNGEHKMKKKKNRKKN